MCIACVRWDWRRRERRRNSCTGAGMQSTKFEVSIDNIKQGEDYATRAEADAAALALRSATPAKHATVREVAPKP